MKRQRVRNLTRCRMSNIKEKRMKKIILQAVWLIFVGLLAGCGPTSLTAPCPDFGARCDKIPVNTWNPNE